MTWDYEERQRGQRQWDRRRQGHRWRGQRQLKLFPLSLARFSSMWDPNHMTWTGSQGEIPRDWTFITVTCQKFRYRILVFILLCKRKNLIEVKFGLRALPRTRINLKPCTGGFCQWRHERTETLIWTEAVRLAHLGLPHCDIGKFPWGNFANWRYTRSFMHLATQFDESLRQECEFTWIVVLKLVSSYCSDLHCRIQPRTTAAMWLTLACRPTGVGCSSHDYNLRFAMKATAREERALGRGIYLLSEVIKIKFYWCE